MTAVVEMEMAESQIIELERVTVSRKKKISSYSSVSHTHHYTLETSVLAKR